MAFASVGSLGTTANKTADQFLSTHTTTATAEAGNLVVVSFASDNPGTTVDEGVEGNEFVACTDSAGNTYTKALEWDFDGGSASQSGATVVIYFCKLTTELTSGGTISVQSANAFTHDASAFSVWEFTCSSTATIAVEATNHAVVISDVMADLDATTANIECLRIYADAAEANTTTGAPVATGFTDWGVTATTGGGSAANMGIRACHKISTGTSDICQPTNTLDCDHSTIYVALKEVSTTPSSIAFTPNSYFLPLIVR